MIEANLYDNDNNENNVDSEFMIRMILIVIIHAIDGTYTPQEYPFREANP